MIPLLKDIQETFALLENWEDRYSYVIDLGRELPEYPESARDENHLVRGCTSRVWMVLSVDESQRLNIIADSDAHIVRGLIALVLSVYDRQKIDNIAQINMQAIFEGLGLAEHLSPNRRNGFFSMVERIKNVSR